jgi:hypothetical protein
MRRALTCTQIAVVLSIDVITRTRTGTRLATPLWVNLTPILFILWAIGQWATRQWLDVGEVSAALFDLAQALAMAAAPFWYVAVILGKSLAFGIGVRI